MSADNGIYILKTKNDYRVTEGQCIENIYWWWEDERLYDENYVDGLDVANPFYNQPGEIRAEINPYYLKIYFNNAIICDTREEADKVAMSLYDNIMKGEFPICEYGIQYVSGWEDKDFPA
jgi:hypothetical protein